MYSSISSCLGQRQRSAEKRDVLSCVIVRVVFAPEDGSAGVAQPCRYEATGDLLSPVSSDAAVTTAIDYAVIYVSHTKVRLTFVPRNLYVFSTAAGPSLSEEEPVASEVERDR